MQAIDKTSRRVCLGAGLLALLLAGGAAAEPPMGQARGERYRSEQRHHDQGSWNRGGRDEARRRPHDAGRAERRHDERYLGESDERYRGRRGAREAADAVRRGKHGRVLSSEPVDDRGYRVRVLTPDGYVRERYVDPYDDRHPRDERRRRD